MIHYDCHCLLCVLMTSHSITAMNVISLSLTTLSKSFFSLSLLLPGLTNKPVFLCFLRRKKIIMHPSQANWCNMTFTAGNLFQSHSCIGVTQVTPPQDSNPDPQHKRWMTYQMSYPCP